MFPAGFLLSQGHVELSFVLRHMSCALFFFVSGGIYSYGGAERLVFCRGKVNTVSLESQQFFPGFLCAGRAWFGSVSRRRSLMRDATEEEGQPTLGVTECNRGVGDCREAFASRHEHE